MANEDRTALSLSVEFPVLYHRARLSTPGRSEPDYWDQQFGLHRGDAEYQLHPHSPCTRWGQMTPANIASTSLAVNGDDCQTVVWCHSAAVLRFMCVHCPNISLSAVLVKTYHHHHFLLKITECNCNNISSHWAGQKGSHRAPITAHSLRYGGMTRHRFST